MDRDTDRDADKDMDMNMNRDRGTEGDTDRDNGVLTIATMSHKKSGHFCINVSSQKEITTKNNMTCKIIFL
jgi:hypothetical protein